ncbi:four helix bundle protein [bacterium]|nr:four helix bundle protein [bacterium]
MKDFRNLDVWVKSHQLTLILYSMTKNFPNDELFGLTSQIRRASSSIPANIAEGCGRRTDADFARFLQIAMGSASELEYHLLLACDLHYIKKPDYEKVASGVVEIKKMLTAFLQRLRAES